MKRFLAWMLAWFLIAHARAQTAAPVTFDLSSFRADAGASAKQESPGLRLRWPISPQASGEIAFNCEEGRPLIEWLGVVASPGGEVTPLMQRVDPVTLLTVGERNLRDPAGWVAFFDNPPLRAYQTVSAVLKKRNVRVTSNGSRTVVSIGEVTAGAFSGRIEFTVCRNSPLVQVETVLQTAEN
ncbi:MAG TPA: hypothetical protein VM029_02330, partial [Opitutaceae bacterium]|nr:hypothetical protein [Opitutaceae bacterium]